MARTRPRSWRLAAVVGLVGTGLAVLGFRGELTGASHHAPRPTASTGSPTVRALQAALTATGDAVASAERQASHCPAPGRPGRLACVQAVDRQLDAAWAGLAHTARSLQVPPAVTLQRQELLSDLQSLQGGLAALVAAPTVQAYDATLARQGLETLAQATNRAATALLADLQDARSTTAAHAAGTSTDHAG
ncbi:hypothetical protein ACFFRE_01575 [Aciditerrimonas ferrireducens]|uniref:Uncharacterized protein n=1 Tax=Aciditerrimonas ferrireducens TaxID=667306 RepID=A0ABV6C1Z1_9ACTN